MNNYKEIENFLLESIENKKVWREQLERFVDIAKYILLLWHQYYECDGLIGYFDDKPFEFVDGELCYSRTRIKTLTFNKHNIVFIKHLFDFIQNIIPEITKDIEEKNKFFESIVED